MIDQAGGGGLAVGASDSNHGEIIGRMAVKPGGTYGNKPMGKVFQLT